MKLIKPNIIPASSSSLLNDRLKDEFEAFAFYRAASNWCNNVGFVKAGKFFEQEANDELSHAKRIEDYLIKWNSIPLLPNIVKPELVFDGLVDIINQAYQIEFELYNKYEEVSKLIFNKDICTFDFLQKYREIQVNSVAEYSDMLNTLALIDINNKFELFYWEKENF